MVETKKKKEQKRKKREGGDEGNNIRRKRQGNGHKGAVEGGYEAGRGKEREGEGEDNDKEERRKKNCRVFGLLYFCFLTIPFRNCHSTKADFILILGFEKDKVKFAER